MIARTAVTVVAMARSRIFGLIAIALLISVAEAHAADVVILSVAIAAPKDDPACNVRLSGFIVPGDNKKIESALETVSQRSGQWSGDPLGTITLCLNSPGGSYAEGLQIANFLLERHLSTVIEPDAICYSACALIFMAGGYGFEGRHFADRRLHVTGQLGFHAPYVKGIPQQTYSSLDLETAYQTSIRAIRNLMKLGLKHRVSDDFMPKTLIVAMLDKEPNELFLVDTVFKAAKLNVALYGARKAPITITGLCNACTSFHSGQGIEWSLDEPPGNCDPSKERIERRGKQTWIGGFDSEGLGYCVAQVPSPYGAPFGVSRNIIWEKNSPPKGDDFYINRRNFTRSDDALILEQPVTGIGLKTLSTMLHISQERVMRRADELGVSLAISDDYHDGVVDTRALRRSDGLVDPLLERLKPQL